MDIRDEIDAMLDNLKNGGKSQHKLPQKKQGSTAAAPRKSVYDNMSVDELVNALSDSKKTDTPQQPVTENKPVRTASEHEKIVQKPVKEASQSSSGIPRNLLDILSSGETEPKKHSPIRKPSVKPERQAHVSAPAEEKIIQKTEIPSEEIQLTETTAETVKPAEDPVAPTEITPPVQTEPEKSAEPSETETKKPPKKKRIIINRELPDYEEIRRRSLEQESVSDSDADKTEDAAVEKVSSPPAEEPEITPTAEETTPEPVLIPEENEEVEEIETIHEASDDESVEEECEETEDKPKKGGFFAGIKSLFSRIREKDDDDSSEEEEDEEYAEDDEVSDTEEETAESSEDTENEEDDKEESSDESIAEEYAESDSSENKVAEQNEASEEEEAADDSVIEDTVSEADISETENTASASELIDAALAAIEETELDSDENSSQEEVSSEETSGSSAADELIADIREDAANVIAGLDEDADEPVADEAEQADSPDMEEKLPEKEDEIEIDVNIGTQKKKGRIVSTLEKILDENPDTISGERREKTEEDEIDVSLEKKNSGRFKRGIYALAGVIFTILAVVGLVTVINSGIRQFRSFTAGETKTDNFTRVIYPAVIMDIESFAAPVELSSEQVISAALWSLVMSEEDMAKYEETFDIISVPAVDVEAYAARLFGSTLPELTHSTVGSGELKFYYNEETKSYNVPVNPITFTYEPEITSVSKNGSEYTVTVDYYKELPSWMKESDNFTKEVSKTVKFCLIENGDSYIISSMTVINVNAVS